MVLEDLVEFASFYNAFLVIDEAFGEYTDPPGDVRSAARLLHRFENLMVLRTFSKKYGLASLRIGYLMCSSPDILEGIQVHRHHFPVTQLSADMALIALEDEAFLDQSRTQNTANRRETFECLTSLPGFSVVPSMSNVFMLKNRTMSCAELQEAFERRGIITSALDISGVRDKGYLRITLRNREDNQYLCQVCREIGQEQA
jgi:histidinol-phosphate aminotransferase